MKIAISTMMWKRPKVFSIFKSAFFRLKRDFPEVDLICTVAGSEREVSRSQCEGLEYIETLNKPIGRKANKRLKFTKKFDPDYVLLMGSDDIMSSKTFAKYLEWIDLGYEEIAPLDIYYYAKGAVWYSKGYQDHRKGQPVAVGRMLSKRVLDKVRWTLFPNQEKSFLDKYSYEKLEEVDHKVKYFRCAKYGLHILDIKTKENMTPFKKRRNYVGHSWDFLTNFPEYRQIMKL